MAAQRVFHLFLILTGIVSFSSVCSGMSAPGLSLDTTVFVAFEGEDLKIDCKISKPANKPKDTMECYDPLHQRIYVLDIKATAANSTPLQFTHTLQLNNVTRSGEYYCVYEKASVYWFLRVRADGYEEPPMLSYTEIGMAVVTGVLLVFSVVGSIYVFRGDWNEPNRGETETRETEVDNVDKETAPSTSFYASLQARPRSIYDVIDHSAANQELDQRVTKPNENEHTGNTEQTTTPQAVDDFQSVYENF
ncbi:uncharacterized protein si:ch211-243a20.4 [Limanda limanda]|uniref:uncharacterized protein si:ch211-243a20.4 n=1 Tax=Limanda limanda TaxID=27771 RepID=UPI0029C7E293|nr:uncharacterized protein si:ch211-243a20.4 [Limanda limanda]